MAASRAGDNDAAEVMLSNYGLEIRAFIRHAIRKAGLSDVTCDDVFQELSLDLILDTNHFPVHDPFESSMIIRKTVNRIVATERRRARRREEKLHRLPAFVVEELRSPAPTPLQISIDRERLEVGLARLSNTERNVARLLMEGNTTAAIASRLKISKRTAQRSVRSFLEALKTDA